MSNTSSEELFIPIPRKFIYGENTENKEADEEPLSPIELAVYVLLNLRKNYYYTKVQTSTTFNILIDDLGLKNRTENKNKIKNAIERLVSLGVIEVDFNKSDYFNYTIKNITELKNSNQLKQGFLKLHINDAVNIHRFIQDKKLIEFKLYIVLLTINSFNNFNLKQHYVDYLASKIGLKKRRTQEAIRYLKLNNYISQLHIGEKNKNNQVPCVYIVFDTYNQFVYYKQFLAQHNKRIYYKGINNYKDVEIENDRHIFKLIKEKEKGRQTKIYTYDLINSSILKNDLPF